MDAKHRGSLILLLAAAVLQAQTTAEKHYEAGLRLLHSFEYDDARDEFVRARKLDASFVMAYWGEAMSYTEFLWQAQDVAEGRAALARLAPNPAARQAAARSERERDYLSAAEALYGPGDYARHTVAFEEAMRQVMTRHPADLDAAAF